MPSHPDRVRRNYEPESVKYNPCDRYTEHVFINGKCFLCDRTEIEIKQQIKEKHHDN